MCKAIDYSYCEQHCSRFSRQLDVNNKAGAKDGDGGDDDDESFLLVGTYIEDESTGLQDLTEGELWLDEPHQLQKEAYQDFNAHPESSPSPLSSITSIFFIINLLVPVLCMLGWVTMSLLAPQVSESTMAQGDDSSNLCFLGSSGSTGAEQAGECCSNQLFDVIIPGAGR